jgi:hypothetical protein
MDAKELPGLPVVPCAVFHPVRVPCVPLMDAKELSEGADWLQNWQNCHTKLSYIIECVKYHRFIECAKYHRFFSSKIG